MPNTCKVAELVPQAEKFVMQCLALVTESHYRKPLWAIACVRIPQVLLEGDVEALREVLDE